MVSYLVTLEAWHTLQWPGGWEGGAARRQLRTLGQELGVYGGTLGSDKGKLSGL